MDCVEMDLSKEKKKKEIKRSVAANGYEINLSTYEQVAVQVDLVYESAVGECLFRAGEGEDKGSPIVGAKHVRCTVQQWRNAMHPLSTHQRGSPQRDLRMLDVAKDFQEQFGR